MAKKWYPRSSPWDVTQYLSSRYSLMKQAKSANSSMEINLSSLHRSSPSIIHTWKILQNLPVWWFSVTFLLSSRRGSLATHLSVALGLLYLVPSQYVPLGFVGSIPEDLAKAIELFNSDLPNAIMLETEYGSWVKECEECLTTVPDTLVSALRQCSS